MVLDIEEQTVENAAFVAIHRRSVRRRIDEIMAEIKYIIDLITPGSIIIDIRPTSKTSVRTLMEAVQSGRMDHFLKEILSEEGVMKYIRGKKVTVNVNLEIPKPLLEKEGISLNPKLSAASDELSREASVTLRKDDDSDDGSDDDSDDDDDGQPDGDCDDVGCEKSQSSSVDPIKMSIDSKSSSVYTPVAGPVNKTWIEMGPYSRLNFVQKNPKMPNPYEEYGTTMDVPRKILHSRSLPGTPHERHITVLQRNYGYLIGNLRLEYFPILDHLVANGLLTDDDIDWINSQASGRQRREAFIDYLCHNFTTETFQSSVLPVLMLENEHGNYSVWTRVQEELKYKVSSPLPLKCSYCKMKDLVNLRKITNELYETNTISMSLKNDLGVSGMTTSMKLALLHENVAEDNLLSALEKTQPHLAKEFREKGHPFKQCCCSMLRREVPTVKRFEWEEGGHVVDIDEKSQSSSVDPIKILLSGSKSSSAQSVPIGKGVEDEGMDSDKSRLKEELDDQGCTEEDEEVYSFKSLQ